MVLNPGWFMALAYWLYHFSLTRGFVLQRFSSIWRNQSLFPIFHEFMAKTCIFHRFFGFSKDSKALPSLRIPRSWSSWQLQSRSLVRCDARRCSAVRGPATASAWVCLVANLGKPIVVNDLMMVKYGKYQFQHKEDTLQNFELMVNDR